MCSLSASAALTLSRVSSVASCIPHTWGRQQYALATCSAKGPPQHKGVAADSLTTELVLVHVQERQTRQPVHLLRDGT